MVDAVMGVAGKPQDENALSLNVWAPAGADSPRPVFVWFHGGGFTGGCGSAPWYDGARLAAKGVVVVTCNYRVGALGFLHLAELLGAPYEESGNVGLLDMVAVLRWVRANVAAFGGDPDQVTIAGESSGAASVTLLLTMPAARGLFRRAVVQSGSRYAVHSRDEADGVARLVLAELGLDAGDAKRLVDVPVADLLAAQQRATARHAAAQLEGPRSPHFRMAIQPVADGVVVPGDVPAAIASAPADIPLLVGSTAEEFSVTGRYAYADGVTDEVFADLAAIVFGGAEAGEEAVRVYRDAMPAATAKQLLFAFETDHYFGIPARRLAEAYAGPAWLYRFTLDDTGMGGPFGAGHALELPFVFDNLDAPGVESMLGPVTPEGRALADAVSGAWVSFVAVGEPAHPRLPAWPPYGERRDVLSFGGHPEISSDPAAAQRRLWETVS